MHHHHQQQQQQRGNVKRAKVDRRGSSKCSRSSKSSYSSALTMGYTERRESVLSYVVTELNEDLSMDPLLDY